MIKAMTITLATTIMLVLMLAPTTSFAAKDGNFKIKVHVGEFPANSQVCAGVMDGQGDCRTRGDANVMTFTFYDVPEGEEIWACVDDKWCDRGTNTDCKCPENLYPIYTEDSQPTNVDVEQESKQSASCDIRGDNNKCEINQGSGIGQDLRNFVDEIFN